MRRLVASALALALASGCATLASRREETFKVTSEPSGADVSLDCAPDSGARTTPASFVIARKTPDCTVTIQKAGFETQTVVVERGVNRWTWANLPIALFGIGVMGMSGFSEDPDNGLQAGAAITLVGLGGLAIDGMTGQLHDHDPKTLHVKLRPSPDTGRR
jgi:hypothetical protein